MKKLFLFFSLLGIIALGFTSCLDDDDKSVYHYSNKPVVVGYEDQTPVLKTGNDVLLAPGLSDTLKAGDCLWSSFTIDMNDQPDSRLLQVSNLLYYKLGKSAIKEVSGTMEDDYTSLIKTAVIYKVDIDSILFFGFTQKKQEALLGTYDAAITDETSFGNGFDYEIMYNTDSVVTVSGREIPKLYIKSKQILTSGSVPLNCHFAFDMREFAKKYTDSSTKKIPLYLHYKVGVTEDGEDIYKAFENYPINWEL